MKRAPPDEPRAVELWCLFRFEAVGDQDQAKVRGLIKWAWRALGMRCVRLRVDDPPKSETKTND